MRGGADNSSTESLTVRLTGNALYSWEWPKHLRNACWLRFRAITIETFLPR